MDGQLPPADLITNKQELKLLINELSFSSKLKGSRRLDSNKYPGLPLVMNEHHCASFLVDVHCDASSISSSMVFKLNLVVLVLCPGAMTSYKR